MTQPDTFDDYSSALRMREVIAKIVREEMNRQRPPARYGKVFSFNRFNATAQVLFAGDIDPTRVKVPQSVQPTLRIETDGFDLADVVRVEGVPGNLWITEILSGPTFQQASQLYSPSLMGGSFLHIPVARHFAPGNSELPPVGQSWFFGRWTNTNSFASDGMGYFEIVVQQSLFSQIIKKYNIVIRSSDTADSWRKCVPTFDSGPSADNNFNLEIRSGSDYVEFRVRNVQQNSGGFTPGGYDFSGWFYGQEWEQDFTAPSGYVDAGVEPARVHGTDSTEGVGPFLSPGTSLPTRSQSLLTGGGAVSYTSAGVLKWTERFLLIGFGKNYLTAGGFFQIPIPVGGVTIPVYGNDAKTSVVTVAGGVQLDPYEALYYEPPWGAASTDVSESRFRICYHTGSKQFQVPSHWILVATYNADAQTKSIRLGTGHNVSVKTNLSFAAGWAANGAPNHTPGYYRMGDRVYLEGVVKNISGATSVASALVATLPVGFRPGANYIFTPWLGSTAAGRLDVLTNGEIRLISTVVANNWFVLDGFSFRAEL